MISEGLGEYAKSARVAEGFETVLQIESERAIGRIIHGPDAIVRYTLRNQCSLDVV
jgi:hypothetical protein